MAEGLLASAFSTDGVVEAVEYRDLLERWAVGVQWHAEALIFAAGRHTLRRNVAQNINPASSGHKFR